MNFFRQHKKWLLPIVVLLAAILIFVVLKSTKQERVKPEISERAWPVEVLTVETGFYNPVQELFGRVRSKQQIKFVAPLSAEVAKIYKYEGESFAAGELLLELNPVEVEIALNLAKADLIEAEAGLELENQAQITEKSRFSQEEKLLTIRQKDFARNQELLARKLISDAQLEQSKDALNRQELALMNAKLALAQQQAKLAQVEAKALRAKAKYDQALLDSGRSKIQPEFAGRIAKLAVAEGDKVNANSLILEAFSADSLEVVASLPNRILAQAQQALLDQQQHASHNQAWLQLNNQQYPLKLSRLSGEASAAGVDALFKLPEDLVLRPGEQVLIQLELPKIEAVAVPYSAIYGFNKVYVVTQDNRLEAREVKQLGDVLVAGKKWLLVQGELQAGEKLLVTHLPNAIAGLLVNFNE